MTDMVFKEMLLFCQKLSIWLCCTLIHSLGGNCYLSISCPISVHRPWELAWEPAEMSSIICWEIIVALGSLLCQGNLNIILMCFLYINNHPSSPWLYFPYWIILTDFLICLVHLALQSLVYMYPPLLKDTL